MDTYATCTSRFPPKLWARFPTEYGIDTPSTTNGCEVFHKHLKEHVGVSHPNIYKFSSVLLERQELTYVKLQSLAATHHTTSSSRRKEIQDTCQLYLNGELSAFLFIQKMSFKFLPVEL